MKICTHCNNEKELSEFSLRSSGKPSSWCKECTRTYNRNKFHSSSEEKQRINKNRKAAYERGKAFVDEYLSDKKCSECGFDHPAALDFHHIDPDTKEFAVSTMKSLSLSRILEEIKKCEILCANCHRIKHYNARQKLVR